MGRKRNARKSKRAGTMNTRQREKPKADNPKAIYGGFIKLAGVSVVSTQTSLEAPFNEAVGGAVGGTKPTR